MNIFLSEIVCVYLYNMSMCVCVSVCVCILVVCCMHVCFVLSASYGLYILHQIVQYTKSKFKAHGCRLNAVIHVTIIHKLGQYCSLNMNHCLCIEQQHSSFIVVVFIKSTESLGKSITWMCSKIYNNGSRCQVILMQLNIKRYLILSFSKHTGWLGMKQCLLYDAM